MGCTSSKNHEQADATKSPAPAAAPAAEPATATATPAVATATTETNEATTAQVEAAAPGTVATDEQADPENVVVPDRTSSYSDAVASPREPQEGDMVFAAYEEEVVTAEQPAVRDPPPCIPLAHPPTHTRSLSLSLSLSLSVSWSISPSPYQHTPQHVFLSTTVQHRALCNVFA
jgi:hypothetical protein